MLTGTDKSSQELCDGLVVYQPPIACHRSGSMGAPRWETVRKKVMVCNKPDIYEEKETMLSVFSKGSIF